MGYSFEELDSGYYNVSPTRAVGSTVQTPTNTTSVDSPGEDTTGSTEIPSGGYDKRISTSLRDTRLSARKFLGEKAEFMNTAKSGVKIGTSGFKYHEASQAANINALLKTVGKYKEDGVTSAINPFKYSEEFLNAGPMKKILMPEHTKVSIDKMYEVVDDAGVKSIDFNLLKEHTGTDFSDVELVTGVSNKTKSSLGDAFFGSESGNWGKGFKTAGTFADVTSLLDKNASGGDKVAALADLGVKGLTALIPGLQPVSTVMNVLSLFSKFNK